MRTRRDAPAVRTCRDAPAVTHPPSAPDVTHLTCAPDVTHLTCAPAVTQYDARMSDAPKSAYELAMEKLKKKDAAAGIHEQVLTDEQRAAIAEARSVHESRVAQRRIMHQSAIAGTFDPAEIEERNAELRRDLEHFESDLEATIRRIRSGSTST
jgi:hypothetical protein